LIVLHGDNAQGKTNLLEAVCVLATLRSFREVRPSRWVQEGAQRARISGVLDGPRGRQVLRWEAKDGVRAMSVDEKPIQDVAHWFAVIRAIVVAPEHTRIVRGEPEERRQFLDRAVFTARPAFLGLVRSYRRVIQHKTALLKSGRATDDELDAWDEQLVVLAGKLVAERASFLAELEGPFRAVHARISGTGDVSLRMTGVGAEPDKVGALYRVLDDARKEERRRGMVLVGPHRDDLEIEVEGRSARRYASQGQARTLVLALKLAELEAARTRGDTPLFLFDDLSSELDRGRLARVIEVVAEVESQVWVTTTDLSIIPGEDAVRYGISSGIATRSDRGVSPGDEGAPRG
jgi:DNA replication and repair protein RecF